MLYLPRLSVSAGNECSSRQTATNLMPTGASTRRILTMWSRLGYSDVKETFPNFILRVSHEAKHDFTLFYLTSDAGAHAQTFKFAWPDGASGKVQARSQGRRTTQNNTCNWDMTSELTMGVQ